VDDPTGGTAVVAATPHLGPAHPLAQVVAWRCQGAEHANRIRGFACGQCWEIAIRADERIAVELGLPELDPDPSYLDPIAIERACRGERVRLTGAERDEVARRVAAGLVPWGFAHQSGTRIRCVAAALPGVAA